IKSEEEKRREVEAQFGELEIPGDSSSDASTDAAAEQSAAKVEASVTEAEASDTPVPYTLAGIGEKTVRKLVEASVAPQGAGVAASAEELPAIPGIGDKTAEKILAAARGDASESGQE